MRLTNNLCLTHPKFGGIKNEPLRYSKFLLDLLRGVNSCLVLYEVYGCTVVQDQCTIVALYYCITTGSLPVYPNTVHGHCTTVVLDTTSNRVYCIATLMECTVQCSAHLTICEIQFSLVVCHRHSAHIKSTMVIVVLKFTLVIFSPLILRR